VRGPAFRRLGASSFRVLRCYRLGVGATAGASRQSQSGVGVVMSCQLTKLVGCVMSCQAVSLCDRPSQLADYCAPVWAMLSHGVPPEAGFARP
jgi:hypothetical protein